jgi:hypothetical protein
LILVLVEYSLGPRVVSTKAVDVDEADRRASIAELSSESSESDGILYHVSSSSESSESELGGEESSD